MMVDEELHECDVLVIGGGLSGCWAALRAKELAKEVLLVDKAKVSRSGDSTFAAGVMLGPTPEDDLDMWMKEIVQRGEYQNDQEWVRVLLEDQIERIKDLVSWGAPLEKDDKGNIVRDIGRGHMRTRVVMFHGFHFMELMRRQVRQRGVTLAERIMITDLLTADGKHPTKHRIVGAVGFDARGGKRHVFKARATVITSNGVGFKARSFSDNITGDGIAQAFRAGAELKGTEDPRAGTGHVFERKYRIGRLNRFVGAGGVFVNAKGERSMERYTPELKDRAQTQFRVRAFVKEGFAGRGPIYADMTHLSREAVERLRRVLPINMQAFDRAGLDITKQKVIYGPAASCVRGGASIRNNIYCETNLPGLYVAGAAGGYPAHGTYSVGGVNIASCCVSGYRAGEYAARYVSEAEDVDINRGQVKLLQEEAFSPMTVKEGVAFEAISERLKDLVCEATFERLRDVVSEAKDSISRHEKRLKRVLSQLEEIKPLLPQLGAPDIHGLVKVNELKNYFQCLEIVYTTAYTAALERTGSSLRWIIIWRDNGGIVTRFVPIPIYRYPVKPQR